MNSKGSVISLGLLIDRELAKMILLKKSDNKVTIIQKKEIAFNTIEDLAEFLEKIALSAGVTKYKKSIRVNCSLSELLIMHEVISLPLQMSNKDIQIYLQLNLHEYFPQANEPLIYDFKSKLVGGKQQVEISAIPQQQVNDYINLGRKTKLKFICIEPAALSLWRAVQYINKSKRKLLIINICSDYLLILSGEQGELRQKQTVSLTHSADLFSSIIEVIETEQIDCKHCLLMGESSDLEKLSNDLANYYVAKDYSFTVLEHPAKQYLAAFGAAIRGLLRV